MKFQVSRPKSPQVRLGAGGGAALGTGSDPASQHKRQKDLADIARLLEAYPALRERVPPEVLSRLV